MTETQSEKLNFYSKYNRVREKQDIESLYALIDDADNYINHFENLILTLNCSRASSNQDNSPIKNINHDRRTSKNKNQSILPNFQEQEKKNKFNEMEEKLRKLQKLQRNFHEQLDKSERQHRRKKQQKQSKRKERQFYRNQLINVIEQTSQHSQYSKQSQQAPILDGVINNQILQSQMPQDFDDYYRQMQEVKVKQESDYDVKETKRKLKEILQIQKQRQRQVESIEENNDGKTSSIVIERLNIPINKNGQIVSKNMMDFSPNQNLKDKEMKNYCEVQLNHSQSEVVLRMVRSVEVEDKMDGTQELNNAAQYQLFKNRNLIEQITKNKQFSNRNDIQDYKQHLHFDNLQIAGQYEAQSEQYLPLQEDDYEKQVNQKQQYLYDLGNQPNNSYQDSQTTPVDKPLTQEQPNNQFTIQNASEINQQIADHVISIEGLSEQQCYTPNNAVNMRSPLFLSQANPRKTFQNQYQVQSIAESLDYNPLENQAFLDKKESKSHIVYGEKDGKNHDFGSIEDKKTSFKKLMAQNRANLIPRLAISTILNEHINQAIGDYRSNQILQISPPPNLHESVISNDSNSNIKSPKINFKSMLRNKNKATSREKTKLLKDTSKIQKNKNLLMNFFDQN